MIRRSWLRRRLRQRRPREQLERWRANQLTTFRRRRATPTVTRPAAVSAIASKRSPCKLPPPSRSLSSAQGLRKAERERERELLLLARSLSLFLSLSVCARLEADWLGRRQAGRQMVGIYHNLAKITAAKRVVGARLARRKRPPQPQAQPAGVCLPIRHTRARRECAGKVPIDINQRAPPLVLVVAAEAFAGPVGVSQNWQNWRLQPPISAARSTECAWSAGEQRESAAVESDKKPREETSGEARGEASTLLYCTVLYCAVCSRVVSAAKL